MLRRIACSSALLAIAGFLACKSDTTEGTPQPPVDAGPAELCQTPDDAVKAVRFSPQEIVLAPGEKRKVRVFIEPDVCVQTPIPIETASAGIAKVEGTFTASLTVAEAYIDVVAGTAGTTKITAKFGPSVATLDVDVRAKDKVACAPAVKGDASPGKTVAATNGAGITIQPGAALATDSIDPLEAASVVEPFTADVACKDQDSAIPGFAAIGPAITFGPENKRFLREVVLEVPVNPAAMPPTAKLKHLRVVYTSPSLKTARIVPVTNPRIEKKGAGYVMRFESNRLGTYQVVVAPDAGTKKRMRHLTHRAVFGFSMGGMGASLFGMNHHDLFDVVAPLGGPMDSNWFLWYFQNYHFGGFCPRKPGDPIPTAPCKADVGKPTEMYEHVQSFEHWWHQKGVSGTGGTFPRGEYVDIFRDVAAMWGNPASFNPTYPHVASGIDMPASLRSEKADYCDSVEKSLVAKTGYYDKQFNPDGKLPVIKFCDGANAPGEPTTWAPGGKNPLEVVVAVDLNGNGTRDEGEPVIIQPHEPYDDIGTDKLASKDEPGYDPVTNPDPNGDDYDPQFNPLGTEGNHRFDEGEPFEDVGLDGVKCPAGETCKYDFGEGNGKFDMTPGLQTFLDRDGRSQINGWSKAPVGGAWDDKALDNLDFYSDGGIRDIFNWGLVGHHYMGGFVARKRPVVYFNDWQYLPGSKATNSDFFDPKEVDFDALPGATYLRYGNIDATNRNIEKGDGQHVGYADQVFRRIQTGLYYIGSRWPDADRKYVENPDVVEGLPPCEGTLSCTYEYKSEKTGRAGPMTVILPPGYHSPDQKNQRYPVVYFLHGYGQTPEDLQAFVLLVSPFMGLGLSSRATRLQKMIMVFVDGRCRGPDSAPECVQGTFYTESVRKDGPKMDTYFLDLMKHIDGKYRTQGPSDVEVTD